ncbi:IclR family transcriptional regulator [Geothermobacter hydrogeniphilus]|uniref:Transcriptional regulator, IclR family n=1 Tax=Geothermobacter hydrogeniphilus TaxID=1969733 RepID=A0A1X0XSD4_9BACT|nr:hypothetical protein B5V00_15110 [Geothermobacter hydrogeniphilus]
MFHRFDDPEGSIGRPAQRKDVQLAARGRDSYSIQSVENALDVLEALCDEEEAVRISRLSQRLGMNKTSVFRLMATFENRGYVEREDNTSKYRLGLSAFEVAQKFLARMGLLRKAKPEMEKLVRDCNETVYLTVRRGSDVLFFDMVDTTHQVKIVSLMGRRYPLTATAAGQIHLAFDDGTAKATNRCTLTEDLARVQVRGWSRDCGVLGDGVASLAVPLFGNGGKLCGGLCMIVPEFRVPQDQLAAGLLPELIETGVVISNKLGHVGHYLNGPKTRQHPPAKSRGKHHI